MRDVGPCPCACNSGGFCGGCGHAGCSGGINLRRYATSVPRSQPVESHIDPTTLTPAEIMRYGIENVTFSVPDPAPTSVWPDGIVSASTPAQESEVGVPDMHDSPDLVSYIAPGWTWLECPVCNSITITDPEIDWEGSNVRVHHVETDQHGRTLVHHVLITA